MLKSLHSWDLIMITRCRSVIVFSILSIYVSNSCMKLLWKRGLDIHWKLTSQSWAIAPPGFSAIITLDQHKKPGSTAKCMIRHNKNLVRQKNDGFDGKMPSPSYISWHCHYQTPPSCEKYFFFQFYSNIFSEPIQRGKWNYIEMNSYIEYHYEIWNVIRILFRFIVYCTALLSSSKSSCTVLDKLYKHNAILNFVP